MPTAALLAVALLLTLAGPPAQGQTRRADEVGAASAKPARPKLLAPIVDWTHVGQAYELAQGWMARGKVDRRPGELGIPVSQLHGVRITLRWLGLTISSAQTWRDEYPKGPNDTSDLVSAVEKTMRLALSGADAALEEAYQEAVERAASEPTVAAPERKTLASLGPKLTLDMQVALQPQPLIRLEDESLVSLLKRVSPGYHGLRLVRRMPDEAPRAAASWPATALAMNLSERSQLALMLSEVGLGREHLPSIGANDGPRLQRFEIIHMAQLEPSGQPLRLTRGHIVRPVKRLTMRELALLGDRMARHLMRRQRGDGSMTGAYAPSADRFDPVDAAHDEAALAVYALATRSNYLRTRVPGNSAVLAMQIHVLRSLNYLLDQTKALRGPNDVPASALLLLTLTESPNLRSRKSDRDQLANRLMALQNKDGSFRSINIPSAAPLGIHAHAVVVDALSALYTKTRDPRVGKAVLLGRKYLWAGRGPQQLVGALPWIATIEHRSARFPIKGSEGLDEQVKGAMPRMLELIRKMQVRSVPLEGPADVVGGYDLKRTGLGLPPRPDWHTAHLIALLAEAMDDNWLAKEDKLALALEALLGARFIEQLSFDEQACFYVRSAADVLGGVRPSFWENRLNLAPTAMSLIASTRLQRALLAMTANSKPQAPASPDGAREPAGDAPRGLAVPTLDLAPTKPQAAEPDMDADVDADDAEPMDGEPMDGEPMDGEPMDGEPMDGEPNDADVEDAAPTPMK